MDQYQHYSISTVTAPTWEPVTLIEAKEMLRVDDDLQDATINALVTVARQWCEARMDRTVPQTTLRLKLDRFPSCNGPIILPRGVTQSVSSITYIDSGGTTQTLSSSLYVVDTSSVPARVKPEYTEVWPSTRAPYMNTVTVEWVSGYASAAVVPEYIKLATKFLVSYWFIHRDSTGEDINDTASNLLSMGMVF